ncbi:MAG: hypothetical protein WAZ27_00090 [Minisyncoccia bacterium]
MKIKKKYQHLVRDAALLVASILFALWSARTGFAESLVVSAGEYALLASAVAGFFFTSLFTLAPASVALAALGELHPHIQIALAGAAGAVIGDLLLFLFVRDRISDDLTLLFSGRRWSTLRKLMRKPLLHWLLPFTGALIIASPLPDELGLTMMGISRVSMAAFVPISFTMNFLGIMLALYIAGTVI